ncbi:MAG: hypothetical protein M3417_12900 [Actinomycetota bacterium]|nr:hypothetical protein [Actinomycetota bacterium]
MARPVTANVRVSLVCEDIAHESTARAFCERIAEEEGRALDLTVASARLGIPRLQRELRALQRIFSSRPGTPDLLVVIIDANAVGPQARHREVEAMIDPTVVPAHVIGTPDPSVERWLLADPASFVERFGLEPATGRATDRHAWKQRLLTALEDSGRIVMQGGAEYADEIVAGMDLVRAGRTEPSLDRFVTDLRAAFRRLEA